jgi:peroxiredoxin
MTNISVGRRLPSVRLARVEDEALCVVDLDRLLLGRKVVVVGLPGAFTPVCSGLHLPALIASAHKLKASGIAEIVCVTPSNPWAVRAWADRADPDGELTFLSDGNLDLARASGLLTREPNLFLGECSQRFAIILRDAVIEKLSIEPRIDAVSCTSAHHLLD